MTFSFKSLSFHYPFNSLCLLYVDAISQTLSDTYRKTPHLSEKSKIFTPTKLCSSLNDETSFNSANNGIPDDYPHREILETVISAVRKACRITTLLQPYTATDNSISGTIKSDASPVTIADFAVQAIVLNLLSNDVRLSNDVFIAEESSINLQDNLSHEIMNVLEECSLTDIIGSIDELKKSIDVGQTYQEDGKLKSWVVENKDASRRWCLDPIDGTRGFLRGKREGGQYCLALALIQDGAPVLGILACPNLPTNAQDENYEWNDQETLDSNHKSRGCIFIASKGGGTFQLNLHVEAEQKDSSLDFAQRVLVTESCDDGIDTSCARFCLGVESYSDAGGIVPSVARKIHENLDSDGQILYAKRMDSQVKYGVLSRGGAEIMARLPRKSYVEWIWDHAAGKIILEEAGGVQTDTDGNQIDYSIGAKMNPDVNGILNSCGGLFHESLLRAYKEIESDV